MLDPHDLPGRGDYQIGGDERPEHPGVPLPRSRGLVTEGPRVPRALALRDEIAAALAPVTTPLGLLGRIAIALLDIATLLRGQQQQGIVDDQELLITSIVPTHVTLAQLSFAVEIANDGPSVVQVRVPNDPQRNWVSVAAAGNISFSSNNNACYRSLGLRLVIAGGTAAVHVITQA